MPDQNLDNGPQDEDPLAELADLILNVGRLVRARTPTGPDVVLMTETERQVMRVVDLYPGSAPSEIAARAHLQRTNVSAALRALEAQGMVTRKPTTGRGIAVLPTRKAAANLRTLRAAWSRELTEALGGNLADVRKCNKILSGLERHLIET
ncbi:MarR family winged helix-turn-helix transcriptional regulator [Kribbella sp. NPDC050470]|uniref:MarR family winged helix-turn-helix transcriptional regulator n=1 Tax=unclassified Kribbella TaxID=2644121 RepID=UPI00378F8C75